MDVHAKRTALGIHRVYKMVDTCSAEFSSPTNYMYSTFDGECESKISDKKNNKDSKEILLNLVKN